MDASLHSQWLWVIQALQSTDGVAATGIPAADVWMGDQNKLPRTPAICVEPGGKVRSLEGAQRQTTVNNDIHIIAYVGRVDDASVNQEDAVILAESIETFLHNQANFQLGGMAIHSMVQEIQPGYATRAGTLMRAARLTFTTLAQERLPGTFG